MNWRNHRPEPSQGENTTYFFKCFSRATRARPKSFNGKPQASAADNADVVLVFRLFQTGVSVLR